MADGKITNAELRAKLATIAPGITVSAATHPDEEDSLLVVVNFLRSLEAAQVEQNAAAPTGQDVSAISVAYGAEQTIDISGTPTIARRATRSVSNYEVQTVTAVHPILV
ncbi:MAG TPA: hypothetical protein V6D28_27885 [Leptolyngbyaceae cyanobacterium]